MKSLPLASVVVVDRHRDDLGDVKALAASIREVGLLHPIVVTSDHRLVAGQRRLEACRLLGFDEIPVTVAHTLNTALAVLRAERDENTCRKEMTPTERASLTDALLELERPKAKERMEAGTTLGSPEHRVGKAADIAAEAAGWSRASYQRTKRIMDAATDQTLPEPVREIATQALSDIEAGQPIQPAAEKVARARIAHAKPEKTRQSAIERVEQIRGLVARGYVAAQIADDMHISEGHVRNIARAHGIELVADVALGRRRHVDSNRIVSETVHALEGLAIGAALIQVDDLDRAQVEGWATSLSNSIRSLNRLVKQLKEMSL